MIRFASAMISGSGAIRTLEIVGVGAGETMITVTVDDGTGEANSAASLVFDVTVVENTAPTLVLETSSAITLPINTTTDTIVSVAEQQFRFRRYRHINGGIVVGNDRIGDADAD